MSRSRYRRRSAEQWQELIDEQADSGLSQRVFCQQKRLSLSTFSLWKRRLAGSEPEQTGESQDPSPWIDLGDLGSGKSGWDIELDLGDGICLRLRRS